MTPDKELVLKHFGFSSETNFMFYYILQLFISIEEERTKNPYNIEPERVYGLCDAPSRLPPNIRNFILWERNVVKRDQEEIMNIEMPRGLTKKYDVKGARLEAEADATVRVAAVQACIDEVEDYFRRFNAVRAIMEATEDRFKTIEDSLLRAESMDGSLASALSEQKRVIEDLRIRLTELNGDLEDDVMPDLIKFAETPNKAQALMLSLSEANVKIRDAIRRYHLGQDNG